MQYTVSQEAQQDIEAIFNYTIDEWGLNQAIKYQALLDEQLYIIRDNPFASHSQKVVRYSIPTRYLRAGKHHIYYTVHNNWIIVLRVLHAQMDADLHLK